MDAAELILKQFPGRIAVHMIEAGKAIGYEKQTCYNLRHRGRFPLRVHLAGTKPMVSLTELIRYLTERDAPAVPVPGALPPVVKRRIGRPRNSEREAA